MTEAAPKPNLIQRLVSVIESAGAVAKTGEATFGQRYKFHQVDEVVDHLREHLVRHGVLMLPTVTGSTITAYDFEQEEKGKLVPKRDYICDLTMDVTFINADDPAERITITSVGQGIDRGDKATGKGMAYALKSALIAMFHLRGQPDNEEQEHDHGNAAKRQDPRQPAPQRQTPPAASKPQSETPPAIPDMEARKAQPWAIPDLSAFEGKLPVPWQEVVNHKNKERVAGSSEKQVVPKKLGDMNADVRQWWEDNWCLPFKPSREDTHLRVALNLARKERLAAQEAPPPADMPTIPDEPSDPF